MKRILLLLGLLALLPGCTPDRTDLGRLERRHAGEQRRLFNRQETEWKTLVHRHKNEIGTSMPEEMRERTSLAHGKERQSLQDKHLLELKQLFERQHEEVMGAMRVFTEEPTEPGVVVPAEPTETNR